MMFLRWFWVSLVLAENQRRDQQATIQLCRGERTLDGWRQPCGRLGMVP
jgi:hypothetical protein